MRIPKLKEAGAAGSDEVGRCGGIAPVAIVGNYLYRDIMLPLRALAVVILIAAAGGVALLTTKGKATVAFAREARTEVRKVIWPTRQKHCTPR